MPSVTPKLTNEELYNRQIEMLKGFIERGAITKAQYDKSAGDLSRLMNIKMTTKEAAK